MLNEPLISQTNVILCSCVNFPSLELGKSINTDEAAALGAVYQAAYLGKGFKVLTFGVKEANMYPIVVSTGCLCVTWWLGSDMYMCHVRQFSLELQIYIKITY